MRTVLVLAALALVAPARAADKPNVLFVVADDLRAELGCYGSAAKTPHIDALAKAGVRFDLAFCQQAVCNPSRSSFLTGKRPDSLHLWSNGTHFREKNPDVITLPQHFQANGYETRCVGKIFHNWHTKEKGDRRSWSADEFLHYANHGDDAPKVTGELPPNLAKGIGRAYGKVPVCECRDVPDEAYYDGRVAAEAVRTLGAIKGKPFFLAVGFWKPHAPFNAPKKYWDLYDRAKLPDFQAARPKGAPEIAFHDGREILGLPPKNVTPTAEQIAEMRHGYFANISYMDAQVGKVLAALDALKLRDNTIVVFLSDHGYHTGELGLWAKTSCFEYDARVPLIVSAPKVHNPGRASRGVVELIDLFPTLTDLAGIAPPKGLDGTSLVRMLSASKDRTDGVAFTQHPRPAYYDREPKGIPDAMGYSARTAEGRYTEWRDWNTGKLLAAEFYEPTERGSVRLNLESNRLDARADSDALKAARAALHNRFSPDVPPAKR